MEPTEKDTVAKKVMNLPPERVSKVLAFIDVLESVGDGTAAASMRGDNWKTENQIGGGGKERNVLLQKTEVQQFIQHFEVRKQT